MRLYVHSKGTTTPAERTTGLRAALSRPGVYDFGMGMLGAHRARERFAEEFIRARPGDTVLDVGCGTGEVAAYLPNDITYTGIDHSQSYIARAKNAWSNQERDFSFRVSDITEGIKEPSQAFDLIIAIGVLHHLSDDGVEALLREVRRTLKTEGRFVSIDPVRLTEQRLIARLLVDRDRGQHVRGPNSLSNLANPFFSYHQVFVIHDALRVPYDHIIIVAQR